MTTELVQENFRTAAATVIVLGFVLQSFSAPLKFWAPCFIYGKTLVEMKAL